MKSFGKITRLGRLRRLHDVAGRALREYGLGDARLRFLTYNGNVVYRVDESGTPRSRSDSPFTPNRYVLRIHMPYHTIGEIQSELSWLSALRREADLAVPEPVPSLKGHRVLEVGIEGASNKRFVSMLKWLDGRFQPKRITSDRARAWGGLMARLHEHTATWEHPKDFVRRHRDWSGLFGEGAGFEFAPDQLWSNTPEQYRDVLSEVSETARTVMAELGRGREAYGLIHADLDVKTNVLFRRGRAGAIDFDDSCFGYLLHDAAFALAPWQTSGDFEWVRDQFLRGYEEVRTWPQDQLRHLDLFLAIYNANLLLWMVDWALQVPDSQEPAGEIKRYGENLLRYGASGAQP